MLYNLLALLILLSGIFFLRIRFRDGADSNILGAAEHMRFQEEEPDSPPAQMSEDDFVELYETLRRTRQTKYFLLFMGLAMVATFFSLAVLGFIKRYAYPGDFIYPFLMVLFLVGGWIGSVAMTIYFYMEQKPKALRKAAATFVDGGLTSRFEEPVPSPAPDSSVPELDKRQSDVDVSQNPNTSSIE